jgi:hypothetical protein
MTISRIVIDQEFATLGIKVTPARMTVSTNMRNFEMKTEASKPEISNTEPPAFQLDFSKLMSDIGVKDPATLSTEYAAKAKSIGLNSVSTAVQEGDHLGAVEKGGDRTVQISKQKGAPKEHDSNIGLIPSHQPDVTWEKKRLNIDWSNHNVQIEWSDDYMPQIAIDPRASVEVFLRNQPKITITVEEYTTGDTRFVDSEV